MAGGRPREYLAFDLETTGLIAGSDRVVEIGAVRFDVEGRELDRFEQLINPGRPMPASAQAIHAISDADLADAPTAEDALPEFLAFLGNPATTMLLAHNAWFDAGFVGCELDRLGLSSPGYAVVDTLALARRKLPDLRNHRLATLARVLGLNPDGPHRALADALRVKGLWLALEGPAEPENELVAYPILEASLPSAAPVGWDGIAEAITRGDKVRIEYSGGTRGSAPREVTPRAFSQRGGVAYLVALCHLDACEKSFRLDRVRHYEVIS